MPQFQKYPDPRRESLYRLLCAILRDLDLQNPERSQYNPATLARLEVLGPAIGPCWPAWPKRRGSPP